MRKRKRGILKGGDIAAGEPPGLPRGIFCQAFLINIARMRPLVVMRTRAAGIELVNNTPLYSEALLANG